MGIISFYNRYTKISLQAFQRSNNKDNCNKQDFTSQGLTENLMI